MDCPYCQAPYQEAQGRFCDACGVAVGPAPPDWGAIFAEIEEASARCSECGLPRGDGETCPNCGRRAGTLAEMAAGEGVLRDPGEFGAGETELSPEDLDRGHREAAAATAAAAEVAALDRNLVAAPPLDLDAPRPLGTDAPESWPEDPLERNLDG